MVNIYLHAAKVFDSGEPYNTNIFKSIEISRFDAALLKALHGQKITVGELRSHLLSLNRIEEIIGLMDRLMDMNFKDRISTVTIKTLEQLIQVRHTVVYEITDISVSAEEALL